MNRAEAWFVHISTLLVGITGIIYAVMRYLMEPTDPFSVVNHPWQPTLQHLHVLVAPLMVFAVGLIWKKHIAGHWRAGLTTGRRSGLSLVLTMVPMIASGYLIQVTVTDTWRTAWIVIHCITSGLWVAGYLTHQVAALIRKRRTAEIRQESSPVKRQPGYIVTH